MIRQQINEELVGILNRLVQNNPDLRFGQILSVYGFVQEIRSHDAIPRQQWKNEFYTEPGEIIQRVTRRLSNEND
jgi:hypothetical protein